MPLPPSNVQRLIRLARKLKPLTINVLIDHPDQLEHFRQAFIKEPQNPRIGVFIKIDTGYHRSGIGPDSPGVKEIVDKIVQDNCVELSGFYSHLGHSYGGNSADEAIRGLIHEIKTAKHAADRACGGLAMQKRVTISVGATPTTTAAQNIIMASEPVADEARQVIEEVGAKCHLELHAGVYPLLDLQQLATHARPSEVPSNLSADSAIAPLSVENIGLRMLVEVTSIYSERSTSEALIAAGTLALGREPCKSYPGWGIVTPWEDSAMQFGQEPLDPLKISPVYDEKRQTGWTVGRISQEHGILVWQGEQHNKRELRVGQKILLWPNHACVAGAGFGWYLIVDSDEEDSDRIVDVWVRCRGW